LDDLNDSMESITINTTTSGENSPKIMNNKNNNAYKSMD